MEIGPQNVEAFDERRVMLTQWFKSCSFQLVHCFSSLFLVFCQGLYRHDFRHVRVECTQFALIF